jgi:hypothetical protein
MVFQGCLMTGGPVPVGWVSGHHAVEEAHKIRMLLGTRGCWSLPFTIQCQCTQTSHGSHCSCSWLLHDVSKLRPAAAWQTHRSHGGLPSGTHQLKVGK